MNKTSPNGTCEGFVYISILFSSAAHWLALLICFPELCGWLWKQRTWNLCCFNVSSSLIHSRSLRTFLSKPIVFICSEKKTRIHVVNVTSNGLSNATAVAHPGHTLFRFQTTSGKKLKSAHLSDFLHQGFLPFLLRVFGSMEGLGDDSARNWPFTFTFMPIPPPLSPRGILPICLCRQGGGTTSTTSFCFSLVYPRATVGPWDKNSSLCGSLLTHRLLFWSLRNIFFVFAWEMTWWPIYKNLPEQNKKGR